MSCKEYFSQKRKSRFGALLAFIILCLIIGFVVGEGMGILLVAQSNKNLLKEQEWLERMKYIAVPGTALSSEIKSLKTYMAGGLFFSLSIGVCYAFVWGLLLWGINHLPKGFRLLGPGCFGLIISLFLLQPGCLEFWTFGLFLILVPLLILPLTILFKCPEEGRSCSISGLPYIISFLGALIIIYILIAPSLTGSDFVRIRDGIFGRTAWGRNVNEFYYHYTLYPAQVIKTVSQKLQTLFRMEKEEFTENELRHLKEILLWRDIFIGTDCPSNTLIKKVKDSEKVILLSSSPKFSLETTLKEISSTPEQFLEKYEHKADTTSLLRGMIGLSLFNIWPIMGIFLLFILIIFASDSLFSRPSPLRDSLIAYLCITLIIIGIRVLLQPKQRYKNLHDLLPQLEEKAQGDRITALFTLQNMIKDNQVKPEELSEYFLRMLNDPDPIIRKWGVYFLAGIKEKQATASLIPLLHDPDHDIAYNAARSLGKMRDRDAVPPLLEIVKGSGEWYLRFTAYIALREIGWKQ